MQRKNAFQQRIGIDGAMDHRDQDRDTQHYRASGRQQKFEPSQVMEVFEHIAEHLINGQEAEDRIDCLAAPGDPEVGPGVLLGIVDDEFRYLGNNREQRVNKEKMKSPISPAPYHQNGKHALQDWWGQPK